MYCVVVFSQLFVGDSFVSITPDRSAVYIVVLHTRLSLVLL